MIEEGLKEFEVRQQNEQVRQAELITVILNAPHQATKGKNELWKVEDYLPDNLREKIIPKRTAQESVAAWEQYIRGFERR